MLIHLTSDADYGTGITKNVLSAQTSGFSMLKESVFQYQTNAKFMLKTETVLNASRDTTLRKENASSLTLTMLIQLILDAGFGIGITKNV